MLKYSLPFFYWGGFIWLRSISDKWALELFSSTEDVGLYTVLNQIGFQTIMFGSTFIAFLVSPILYELSGDNSSLVKTKKAQKLANITLLFILVSSLIAFVVTLKWHATIFALFVDITFQPISYLLPFMVLSGGVFACGDITSLQLQVGLRTDLLLIPRIVTAILGICLNTIGAYYWKIDGVVYATLISYLIFFFWVIILCYRNNLKLM